MGRGGLSCRRTIPRGEDGLKTLWRTKTSSNLGDGTDESSDHVFEETVGIAVDVNLIVPSGDGQLLEVADWIFVIGEASLK